MQSPQLVLGPFTDGQHAQQQLSPQPHFLLATWFICTMSPLRVGNRKHHWDILRLVEPFRETPRTFRQPPGGRGPRMHPDCLACPPQPAKPKARDGRQESGCLQLIVYIGGLVVCHLPRTHVLKSPNQSKTPVEGYLRFGGLVVCRLPPFGGGSPRFPRRNLGFGSEARRREAGRVGPDLALGAGDGFAEKRARRGTKPRKSPVRWVVLWKKKKKHTHTHT